jgi:hypothetical protein
LRQKVLAAAWAAGAEACRVLGPVAFPGAVVPVAAVVRAVPERAAAPAVELEGVRAAISGKVGGAVLERALEADPAADQGVALELALAVDWVSVQEAALERALAVDPEAGQGAALELALAVDRVSVQEAALERALAVDPEAGQGVALELAPEADREVPRLEVDPAEAGAGWGFPPRKARLLLEGGYLLPHCYEAPALSVAGCLGDLRVLPRALQSRKKTCGPCSDFLRNLENRAKTRKLVWTCRHFNRV